MNLSALPGLVTRHRRVAVPAALAALLLSASSALGQLGSGDKIPEPDQLVRASSTPIEIAAGRSVDAMFTVRIEEGWHINANPPFPDYMIATELTLAGAGGLKLGTPRYPVPRRLKVGFEESELLVYDGEVVLRVPISTTANTAGGTHRLKGSIRFQACNDQVCLAPASVPVELVVTVTGVASLTATDTLGVADTSTSAAIPEAPDSLAQPAPVGSGFVSGPTSGAGGEHRRRLDQALARGGLWWFLALFVGGLLLNLTPCVFPMLGITVSIFGARRQEPTGRVISHAVVYVLGIAVMYSALGVVAGLTGGLFGAALQNTWVSVGLGAVLIVLSFSMFGLYEIQPPAWVMNRLGGANTASLAGIFLSGLGVGIIAAPCVGPFVVAVLALIAAKQDALFGLQTMFALSLGLGFPYLLLASFSNLLQSLPRSGEWMIWVKKVFGVILFAFGSFYALLAVSPKAAFWVAPAALVLGGIYLGFFEKSADQRPRFRWFKRLGGAAAAIVGIVLVTTAPTEGIAFEKLTAEALESTLSSGTPVMLDFTANWCAPCHELDRFTFTDRRVRHAAREFRAFRVDLTRYDSPESENWRRRFAIAGVPTVVFLTPDGAEVPATRVEGFLPPEPFLERMRHAAEVGAQAARE